MDIPLCKFHSDIFELDVIGVIKSYRMFSDKLYYVAEYEFIFV